MYERDTKSISSPETPSFQAFHSAAVLINLSTTPSPLRSRKHLSNLATDGTRDGERRVDVGEEAGGVVLNALDLEAEAGVDAGGHVLDAGDEAVLGALDAADGAADALADGLRVGEGDARRAGLALGSLVDVRRGRGRGLVVAAEVVERDVVADHVLVAVEAELVQAGGAGETAGVGVGGVDDLVGGGLDLVGGGELEGALLRDWEECVSIVVLEVDWGCWWENSPSSCLLPHFWPQCWPQMGVAMAEAAMDAATARENFILTDMWCWCCWSTKRLVGFG